MSQMMPPPEGMGAMEDPMAAGGYEDISDEDIMMEAEMLRNDEPIADELLEDIIFSHEDADDEAFEDSIRRAKEYLGIEDMSELDLDLNNDSIEGAGSGQIGGPIPNMESAGGMGSQGPMPQL